MDHSEPTDIYFLRSLNRSNGLEILEGFAFPWSCHFGILRARTTIKPRKYYRFAACCFQVSLVDGLKPCQKYRCGIYYWLTTWIYQIVFHSAQWNPFASLPPLILKERIAKVYRLLRLNSRVSFLAGLAAGMTQEVRNTTGRGTFFFLNRLECRCERSFSFL